MAVKNVSPERVLSAMGYQRAAQILLQEAQRHLQWERKTESWQPCIDKGDPIRCGEQITEANITGETKRPILLPKNSEAASLPMIQAHQQ